VSRRPLFLQTCPPKKAGTVYFIFRRCFGIFKKKGSEDALRSTFADFVINKSVPAKMKKECKPSYKEKGVSSDICIKPLN
jgi:hypothetical protein